MSLTSTRTVMGTAEFLAPERIHGEEAGPAADLWSLGVTLFCALEGYSPFLRNEGSCPEATMWAILREDPPAPARPGGRRLGRTRPSQPGWPLRTPGR